MTTITYAINIFQLIIFAIIFLLAAIYSISILLIHRVHHCNNIFTVNLCFAAIFCCSYWIFFYVMLDFYLQYLFSKKFCFFINYFEMMCTLQVPLGVVVVSIHRLCCIIYHKKGFFKGKRWAMICITIQWTIGIIFSIPHISFDNSPCFRHLWMKIYTLIITVIIPSFICLIINLIIFKYVCSSSNRIQPTSQTIREDSNNNQLQRITRRDMHLLRHIIIMFCIFIGGWSPVFIITIVRPNLLFTSLTISLLILLAEFALLIDIVNLFVYNHELRRCLKDKTFICK